MKNPGFSHILLLLILLVSLMGLSQWAPAKTKDQGGAKANTTCTELIALNVLPDLSESGQHGLLWPAGAYDLAFSLGQMKSQSQQTRPGLLARWFGRQPKRPKGKDLSQLSQGAFPFIPPSTIKCHKAEEFCIFTELEHERIPKVTMENLNSALVGARNFPFSMSETSLADAEKDPDNQSVPRLVHLLQGLLDSVFIPMDFSNEDLIEELGSPSEISKVTMGYLTYYRLHFQDQPSKTVLLISDANGGHIVKEVPMIEEMLNASEGMLFPHSRSGHPGYQGGSIGAVNKARSRIRIVYTDPLFHLTYHGKIPGFYLLRKDFSSTADLRWSEQRIWPLPDTRAVTSHALFEFEENKDPRTSSIAFHANLKSLETSEVVTVNNRFGVSPIGKMLKQHYGEMIDSFVKTYNIPPDSFSDDNIYTWTSELTGSEGQFVFLIPFFKDGALDFLVINHQTTSRSTAPTASWIGFLRNPQLRAFMPLSKGGVLELDQGIEIHWLENDRLQARVTAGPTKVEQMIIAERKKLKSWNREINKALKENKNNLNAAYPVLLSVLYGPMRTINSNLNDLFDPNWARRQLGHVQNHETLDAAIDDRIQFLGKTTDFLKFYKKKLNTTKAQIKTQVVPMMWEFHEKLSKKYEDIEFSNEPVDMDLIREVLWVIDVTEHLLAHVDERILLAIEEMERLRGMGDLAMVREKYEGPEQDLLDRIQDLHIKINQLYVNN